MIGYCITRYQMSGQANMGWLGSVAGVSSIAQVGKAQSAARHLARAKVRAQLARTASTARISTSRPASSARATWPSSA